MTNTLGNDIKNDVEQIIAQFYLRYGNRSEYLIGTAKGYLTDMERAALSYKPDSRVEQILQGGNITRKQLLIAQLLDSIEQNIRTVTEKSPLLPDEMKQAQREDVTKWVARLLPVLYNKLDRIFISGVGSYEASKQMNELIEDNLPGLYGILDFHQAKADTYLAARGKDPFGMGRYRFQNGDGENTCAVCHGNDGQTYTLNELTTLGLIPPLHKNCRCKIVAEDSAKQPTSREKSYKNRLEEQIRIQEDIAAGGLSKKNYKAGDIYNNTDEESNYTAVKEDNLSERIKLPSPFMADAFGSKILNEPLPFDLFRGNMSAIEKAEYYITQGQNTANNWLKAGWITLLLMNTPAKTIELIGKPFEQQYNYATGFSNPETAKIFGKVMSGYLIGSAIKDASKGLDMLEDKGIGLTREGLGRISGNTYQATQQEINAIKNHLISTGMTSAENSAMISRIENSLRNGQAITGADASFYLHELKEASLMQSGMSYGAAHQAALDFYGVSPYSVYDPAVIQQFPEEFNSNWFIFWGIK